MTSARPPFVFLEEDRGGESADSTSYHLFDAPLRDCDTLEEKS